MKKEIVALLLTASLFTACGAPSAPVSLNQGSSPGNSTPSTTTIESNNVPSAPSMATGTRDNTPVCLETTAPGLKTEGNEYATVDYSNSSEGYIMVNYLGSSPKVKLQIAGPHGITYTYNLTNGYAAFPLTQGDGAYDISVCENIEGTKYTLSFKTTLTFSGISEFGPYLYPNQYVYFDKTKKTVAKGSELAKSASTDLQVITNVYNYIISNITYDYDKANSVASGYISDIDIILDKGTGICLDYASVMTTMLRTQRIPTRLEVGYAGEVYHAWISVYTEETGWLNGVIQFNGREWELVDPTFGASTNEKKLKEYIGEGSNYSTKYIY